MGEDLKQHEQKDKTFEQEMRERVEGIEKHLGLKKEKPTQDQILRNRKRA